MKTDATRQKHAGIVVTLWGFTMLAFISFTRPNREIISFPFQKVTAFSDSQIIINIPKGLGLKLMHSDNIVFRDMNDSQIIFSTRKEGRAFLKYVIGNKNYSKTFDILPNTIYDSFVKKNDLYHLSENYKKKSVVMAATDKKIKFASATQFTEYENKEMPYFSFKDVNGMEVSTTTIKGKVSIINFWFLGCRACMYEIPELNKLQNDFKNNADIEFLSFFNDSMYYDSAKGSVVFENNHVAMSTEPISKFLPVEYSFRHVHSKKELDKTLAIMGYPTTIIIDRSGIIRRVFLGYSPTNVEDIRRAVIFENDYRE